MRFKINKLDIIYLENEDSFNRLFHKPLERSNCLVYLEVRDVVTKENKMKPTHFELSHQILVDMQYYNVATRKYYPNDNINSDTILRKHDTILRKQSRVRSY